VPNRRHQASAPRRSGNRMPGQTGLAGACRPLIHGLAPQPPSRAAVCTHGCCLERRPTSREATSEPRNVDGPAADPTGTVSSPGHLPAWSAPSSLWALSRGQGPTPPGEPPGFGLQDGTAPPRMAPMHWVVKVTGDGSLVAVPPIEKLPIVGDRVVQLQPRDQH
jgi:hypothetical protein